MWGLIRNIELKYTVFTLCALLIGGVTHAHIKNEATQFPDIEFSDARFDIVLLVGAGIIPETPVFEPDKPLSMKELATWLALAEGLTEGGETPDLAAMSALAVEQGFVDSVDGDATFSQLNQLIFNSMLVLDNPDQVPTKAVAASLIAEQFDSELGLALLQKRGLDRGASGMVSDVEVRDGHHGNAYFITIGDTTLEMDAHGRVANGPTDLLQWRGKNVSRSFVRGSGHHAQWTYLEAVMPAPTAPVPDVVVAAKIAAPENLPAGEQVEAAPKYNRQLLYLLVVAALVLGAFLFSRRRRKV